MGPLVVLLDVDGTLVGDVTHQVVMYELANVLKRKTRFSYGQKDIVTALKTSGLLRPGTKCFLEQLKANNIEVFIYTAAEKKWAEYIIKGIEQTTGVKFNRPLFTRDNCIMMNGELKKSIKHITPLILRSLKKKPQYKDVTSLSNSVIAVDNNPVFIEEDLLVLCDTYSVTAPVNIPKYIPFDLWLRYYKTIQEVIIHYYPIKETTNFYKFERSFYTLYIDYISNAIKQRGAQYKDMLFETLRDIIGNKSIQDFSPKVVYYINKKCKKQIKKHDTRQGTFF